MSDKTHKSGDAFMIGQGPVGAIILDILAGPCLRIDDKRWSMNTARGNLVLSHVIVERLLASGWVMIHPEKLMDRDRLVPTEKGRSEAIAFAFHRSRELAIMADPPSVVVRENIPPVTMQQQVYDLAEMAFKLDADDRLKRGDEYATIRSPGHLIVDVKGEAVEIADFLKRADISERAALLFELIGQLADSSLYGLTIAEMGGFARWGGTIAAERFERAPDQDWEFDEGGSDE